MTTTDPRTDRQHSSLGVDAVTLERFVHLETEEGECLLYDRDEETAWMQSDLYVPRASMV